MSCWDSWENGWGYGRRSKLCLFEISCLMRRRRRQRDNFSCFLLFFRIRHLRALLNCIAQMTSIFFVNFGIVFHGIILWSATSFVWPFYFYFVIPLSFRSSYIVSVKFEFFFGPINHTLLILCDRWESEYLILKVSAPPPSFHRMI